MTWIDIKHFFGKCKRPDTMNTILGFIEGKTSGHCVELTDAEYHWYFVHIIKIGEQHFETRN